MLPRSLFHLLEAGMKKMLVPFLYLWKPFMKALRVELLHQAIIEVKKKVATQVTI